MCAILTYTRKEADEAYFADLLERTASRGPDMSRIMKVKGGLMGFNRLSIMGLNEAGMQPFTLGKSAVV